MKKLVAGVVVAASLLVLTGCGEAVYGRAGSTEEIQDFKKFADACDEAGGTLKEGARDWYTCDMGGAG